MGRYTFRWVVTRLMAAGGILLAVQFLSQLSFMSTRDSNLDCEQQLMFRKRISELITPPVTQKSEDESSAREVSTTKHISEEASKNLAQSLRQLALELIQTQRGLSYSAQHFNELNLHVQAVNRILKTLQEDEVRNDNSFIPGKVPVKNSASKKQEVCPEKFMGKNLAYGYPFFRKGFEILNCTDFVPMHTLVTILIDTPQELPKPADNYLQILQGVEKYYPKVRVILRTEKPMETSMSSISKLEIDFQNEVYSPEVPQGKVWDKLLQQVQTPYVLVAPQITHFNDDIDLKRLIRVLSNNDGVMIAGGSYRNLQGEWDIGCQQTSFKNWTVSYKGGYYHSFSECVVCDFMPGPWVAKTQELKELKFDQGMPYGAFHDLFWRLKKSVSGHVAVSCPDVMFNVITRDVKDAEYAPFANKFHIKKWIDPDGRVRWYGCRRGHAHASSTCSVGKGIGVPPCNLENLADAIKFVMKECEDGGMFCEFQEGTLLGAVKFNKVLPWERDADITFLTANYSAFKRLQSKFSAAGYSLHTDDGSIWCCADGRQAGGKFRVGTSGWTIEMYGQHIMESELLAAKGQKPTKVQFSGQWVSVMRNPGLFARNRYGPGIYQHQEHWMDTGHSTGWAFYSPGSFSKCPHPGHSGCLDQYSGDGNMQFSDYCLP